VTVPETGLSILTLAAPPPCGGSPPCPQAPREIETAKTTGKKFLGILISIAIGLTRYLTLDSLAVIVNIFKFLFCLVKALIVAAIAEVAMS
jgi:hypothetical protein